MFFCIYILSLSLFKAEPVRVTPVEEIHPDSLVIYFSRAGENYFGGDYKTITKGNTEVLAEEIAKQVHADMFKIVPEIPYPDNYHEATEVAKKALNENARPAVKAAPTDISQYSTIYIGYPIWWGHVPMHMFTALEKLDATGKTIRPFCTHEGSGLGDTLSDLKKIFPNAKIEQGLAVQGSSVHSAEHKVRRWLNTLTINTHEL